VSEVGLQDFNRAMATDYEVPGSVSRDVEGAIDIEKVLV
jgi:hypothetical protein